MDNNEKPDLQHIATHAKGLVERADENIAAGHFAVARNLLMEASGILRALDCGCAAHARSLAIRLDIATKSRVGLC